MYMFLIYSFVYLFNYNIYNGASSPTQMGQVRHLGEPTPLLVGEPAPHPLPTVFAHSTSFTVES